MINFDNYRLIALRDGCDYDNILGAVYLHNKHSVKDFQDAIYKAKEKWQEEIYENGNDWAVISEELDKNGFDYFEIDTNFYEDSVEF